MAGVAFTPELAFVWLVLLVTVHALGLRAAIRFSRHVAARARDRCVRPMQLEVGTVVIELIATEFDDIARASQVLRMTRVALRQFDALELAMEAMLPANVSGNVLVTIEAQLGLAMAVAAIVALLAVLLVLLMRHTQLSGHEQCLRIDGFTASYGRQTRERCADQHCEPLTPLHVTSRRPSVDVYGDHVDDSRGDQYEKERDVKCMPQREQALV
jgi:hypothetical protein